jgi:hypothetical protein
MFRRQEKERWDLKDQNNLPPKRRYPPLYEKIIPIVVGIIVVAIIVLLVFIVGIMVGLFPGTR